MKKRMILGLLVAPLFPAVAAALLAGLHGDGFDTDTATAVAFGCLVGGYVTAVFIGFPLSLAWRRFGWISIAGGVALGIVSATFATFILYQVARPLRHSEVSLLVGLMNLLALTLPLGAVGGFVFWWFGLRSPNSSLEGDACKATRASG